MLTREFQFIDSRMMAWFLKLLNAFAFGIFGVAVSFFRIYGSGWTIFNTSLFIVSLFLISKAVCSWIFPWVDKEE